MQKNIRRSRTQHWAMALNKLIDARAYQMEDMKATLRLRVDNEQLQQHQQQQQI